MARQFIPRVQPSQIREQPDQFCAVINAIIDRINELD